MKLQLLEINKKQPCRCLQGCFCVPEAGLEPARLLGAKDFESFVSTISPLGRDAGGTYPWRAKVPKIP